MMSGNILGVPHENWDSTAAAAADNFPISRTEYSITTNCLADTFSASSPNPSNKAPEICGTNTGHHMYIDADTECNTLEFNLAIANGPDPGGQTIALSESYADSYGVSSLASRSWDMTVTQYECGHILQAPPGCTQFHYGATTGFVRSYNYDALTKHLANQNQKICIRREASTCYACYAVNGLATGPVDAFDISPESTAQGTSVAPGVACGYTCEDGLGMLMEGAIGAAGTTEQCGYDCIIIPGAFAVGAHATISTGSGTIIAAPTTANIQAFSTQATYQFPVGPQFSGGLNLNGGAAILENTNFMVNGDWTNARNTPYNTAQTICTKTVPFTVIVKTDAMEGLGIGQEAITTAQNRGVKLTYSLVSC